MPATLVRPKPSVATVLRSIVTPSASSPMFSVLPTTPTAEIMRSAVIVVVPPTPSSIVAVMESAPFCTPVTLAPVRILMPIFSNRPRAKAAISGSSTGRICGSTSTMVTSAPMARSDFGKLFGTMAS